MERREVSSRSNTLIRGLASALARSRITPNQISAFSAVIALLVPVGLLCLGGWPGIVVALLGIQLRLLANVIDGLVAIEGGKASDVGALYNEFPDRISDSIVLVALGYAADAASLGWLAALLAALTAYVRAFGGALGLPQSFAGPMAKQHRMAVATVALLAFGIAMSLSAPGAALPRQCLLAGLAVICAGSAWTCVRRTRIVTAQLRARAADAGRGVPSP
ncbi:CDP-alcohol phosphatidyltransferase family protein [Roseateles chitinivorans]|uniref:CDP-alcohol phosphatidyltransferase family protein n=1 Tax=Roseateles chitinivorans TaxID=2917965 RepID=UPI003D66A24B